MLGVMCRIQVPRFDLETLGGVIEAIHEVEAALSEFKEKVSREGAPAQAADAAAPAEQPADVIEPDCDGELVWCPAKANLGQPVLHLTGADFAARRGRREHENYLKLSASLDQVAEASLPVLATPEMPWRGR